MKPFVIHRIKLFETATLAYLVLTGFYIGFNYSLIEKPWLHLLARLIMVALIFLAAWLRENVKLSDAWTLIFNAYPLVLLIYLYPETDAMNNIFYQNLDMNFVFLEYTIFGFQPSIECYKHFLSPWMIELMSFGYFSFYLMLIGGLAWIYFKNQQNFSRAFFIVCSSFFAYYLVFIIYPVVGPQFFFSSPDNFVGDAGPFRWIMKWIEIFGNRPTGAFPSSQAGIVLILLILIFRVSKLLFLALLPFAMLSLVSSVYLKENYVIGVASGLVSGVVFYFLFSFVFRLGLKMGNKGIGV